MKRISIISYILIWTLLIQGRPLAAAGKITHSPGRVDTALSSAIERQLDGAVALNLYFPKSINRFYRQNSYRAAWLRPQSGTGPTWQAMMMIDCVLQYGLCYADYHPNELVYDKLNDIMDSHSTTALQQQARFEIMLTDAMINLINNLHYGKLNPDFSSDKIDAGNTTGFSAEAVLASALGQKDFMSVIDDVQPKCKDYVDLQRYMRRRVGLQSGDCYDVPEAEIRKMAVNLERLRWAAIGNAPYVQINIPTYTLTLAEPDSIYQFKVIAGKPQNPTPQLNSAISYFSTSPDWKVPARIFRQDILPNALADTAFMENSHFTLYDRNGSYVESNAANLALAKRHPGSYRVTQSAGCDNALGLVVFRFPNVYDIYLHDTPEQKLFKKEDRDFSHGCVRVEKAEELAATLLRYDGQNDKIPVLHKAVARRANKNFVLKNTVPIKITYITCTVGEYGLITYKDVYSLDNRLEMALYNVGSEIALR